MARRADFRPLKAYRGEGFNLTGGNEVNIVTQADLDAGCRGIVLTGGPAQTINNGAADLLVYPTGAGVGDEWANLPARPNGAAGSGVRNGIEPFRLEWDHDDDNEVAAAGGLTLYSDQTTVWWVTYLR